MIWRSASSFVAGAFLLFNLLGCGQGGGFDIGNAAVSVKISDASGGAFRDSFASMANDNLSDLTVPVREFQYPYEPGIIIMHLDTVELEIGGDCGNRKDEYPVGVSHFVWPVSSTVLFPGGAVIPPPESVEVEGHLLCSVRVVFESTHAQPAVDMNVLSRDDPNARGKFVSYTKIDLYSELEDPLRFPTQSDEAERNLFELDFIVETRSWLNNVENWVDVAGNPIWGGGLDEQAVVHQNIASSFDAKVRLHSVTSTTVLEQSVEFRDQTFLAETER